MTRDDASAAFLSTRAALSAYSNLLLRIALQDILPTLGCLMRTTPVAAAKIVCMMRLTLALTPASARELSRKNIILSGLNAAREAMKVITACVSSFEEYHIAI